MAFDPVTAALEVGNRLISHFFPDKAQQDAARLKLFELQQTGALQQLASDTQLAQAQADINKIEAASPITFISGWRPGVGWVCMAAFSINFVVNPLLVSITALFGHPVVLPVMNMAELMPVLLGILGLGAYRAYEKVNSVASK